jgi:hypothetical protein
MEEAKHGEASGFYVPNDAELRKKNFDEAHQTWYTIHPDNTKMYRDLNKFW